MGKALKFRNQVVPRHPGEMARLKVAQGPDYGSVFVIVEAKATVGRGADNDVVISDLKSSRSHAEFSLTQNGWNVRDLGSANGIVHNGKLCRQANLKSGDTVAFGETTLEFMAGDAATMMVVAPPKSPQQINSENQALEAQKNRVRALGGIPGIGGPMGIPQLPQAAQKQKSQKLIYVALGVVGLALFLGDDGKKPQPAGKKPGDEKSSRDLASFLPSSSASYKDAETNKTADMFFKAGFREYREGNYLRARTQFETVLQMLPDHRLATIYLQNCNKEIVDEVKKELENGSTSMAAGKLHAAKGHFEAVMRLLFKDPNNEDFKTARERLEKVMKQLQSAEEDRV